MNKRPEATAVTRGKFIDAYWKLLEDPAKPPITVKAIAGKAGFNRGTFYQYFEDVRSLAEGEEDALLESICSLNMPQRLMEGGVEAVTSAAPFLQEHAYRIALLLRCRGTAFEEKVRRVMYPFLLEQYGLEDKMETRVLFSFFVGGIASVLALWHEEGGLFAGKLA